MSARPGVREAARNNAEWCDAFCRTHGVAGRFDTGWWSSRARTPPLYPDAVTLLPGVSTEVLVSLVDAGAGCSIKDSFAELDLAPAGFEILFRAEWLCRQATDRTAAPGTWSLVRTPAELERWESAWGASPGGRPFFRSALLGDGTVAVFARYADGHPVAGAIANRSSTAIGLTNVFDAGGDPGSAWAAGAAAARACWGPLPVVGYAAGDALEAANVAGFVTIGELTVWANPDRSRSDGLTS